MMKYDKFIMSLKIGRRFYVNLLIGFIVISLLTPIYHQHVDNDHHSESTKHTDHIAPHHSNDYSVDLHGTDIFADSLPEKTDHSHNHAHFEKDLFRKTRIETITAKTTSVYDLVLFDISSKHLLPLSKFLNDPYTTIFYSQNSAKTSSGLSPPVYSS